MPQYIDLLNAILESHDGDDYFEPRVLAQAAAQNDLSREILIHMSPENFLKVAGRGYDAEKMAKTGGLINQGVPYNEIPVLSFIHDGKGTAVVTDHNGRHRARHLMDRGVQSMPVLLKSHASQDGRSMRWGSVDRGLDRFDQEWPRVLRGQKGDNPGHEHNSIAFPVSDSRKPLTEARFRPTEIMYHGTSSSLVRSITKEGVIPFPKKRVWDKDEGVSVSTVSRKSIGGSYWTTNLMTALSSAWNARKNLGGANRLIVIAQIQQQSAFSDEDNINSPVEWALADTARAFGTNSIMHVAYLFWAPGHEAKRHYAVELFREKLAKNLNATYVIPAEQAQAIIIAAIRRLIAHEFRHDVERDGYISSSNLERFGLQSRDDIPRVEQAEEDYLRAREALTRTFRHKTYSEDDPGFTTLRLETPVGFSGANKILAIVESVEHREPGERDHFVLHYGTIPEDFRAQWQRSVGSWRPVYDAKGRLLEPAE